MHHHCSTPLWVPKLSDVLILAPGQARGPVPTVIAWVNAGPLWVFVIH